MGKIRRQRRGESAWRELVARQARSGLTVRVFCERERISAVSFYGWRSRLKGDTGDLAPEGRRALAPAIPGFIDLGHLGDIQAKRERFEVRLDLGAGMVLSIGRG